MDYLILSTKSKSRSQQIATIKLITRCKLLPFHLDQNELTLDFLTPKNKIKALNLIAIIVIVHTLLWITYARKVGYSQP